MARSVCVHNTNGYPCIGICQSIKALQLHIHSQLMNDQGLEILRLRQRIINYEWIACETFDPLVEYHINVWALFQSWRHFIDNNHQKIINDALKRDFNGYCLCSLPLLRPWCEQREKKLMWKTRMVSFIFFSSRSPREHPTPNSANFMMLMTEPFRLIYRINENEFLRGI